MKHLNKFNENEVYNDPIKKKGEEVYAYLNKEGAKIKVDNQSVEEVQPGIYHIMEPDDNYRYMTNWRTIKVESPMKPYDLALQTFIKFGKKPVDTPFELSSKGGLGYTKPSVEMVGDNIFPLQPTLFENLNNERIYNFKNFNKVNEARIYDHTILPPDALKELKDYVDYEDPKNKIEVVRDPYVSGAYALQVYRAKDNVTFHLLWNRGAYDEGQFDSFPPGSSEDNLARNTFFI